MEKQAEEQTLNSKETTEALVQQDMTHKPEDIAAAFFMRQEPKFIQLVDKLSLRAAKRLIMHLALGPLANKDYKLNTDEEKSAAYIGNELIFNRVIMQLSEEMRVADEAAKANPNLLTEETKKDTIDTNNNEGVKENVESNQG